MKIWAVDCISREDFAWPIRVGNWEEGGDGDSYRAQPLVVEWQKNYGSEIADFNNVGCGGELMITRRVVDALEESSVKGFVAGPVEFKNKLGRGRGKKTLGQSDLPELCELWVDFYPKLDLDRTTFEVKHHPSEEEVRCLYESKGLRNYLKRNPFLLKDCGKEYREYTGFEWYDLDESSYPEKFDPNDPDCMPKNPFIHIPRKEGCGLFVMRSCLKGRDIFRVDEDFARVLCTDKAKVVIENHNFTNVRFLEMGDVIED